MAKQIIRRLTDKSRRNNCHKVHTVQHGMWQHLDKARVKRFFSRNFFSFLNAAHGETLNQGNSGYLFILPHSTGRYTFAAIKGFSSQYWERTFLWWLYIFQLLTDNKNNSTLNLHFYCDRELIGVTKVKKNQKIAYNFHFLSLGNFVGKKKQHAQQLNNP